MNLPRFHIEGYVYYITTVIYNRIPVFTFWGSTSGNIGWAGITRAPTGESRALVGNLVSARSSSRARKPASDN